ncbi:BTAD domain-containing putative transcriptional regulator [Nonomuraea sp. NPDC050786]|uniref:AfsR/SARP family transcriptional regulator n=1 Tax=Nonomuraea sp. NPDC050786 TaxID=3154840 RepID=UPI0033F8DD60
MDTRPNQLIQWLIRTLPAASTFLLQRGSGLYATAILIKLAQVNPFAIDRGRMTAGPAIRLLGPVIGVIDDQEIDLGTPRQQAIMVMLATRSRRVVTMTQLVEGLWGDCPPPTAEQSVYTYIAGLRRACEPDRRRREPSKVVVGASGGYVLHVDPSQVDACVFAELLDTARQAVQDHDLDRALGVLDQALALWTGPALSGVPGPFAEGERARLEELHLIALETRADALLQLGRPQETVADLQNLTRRHPLRERSLELLMLALHGCGRQAEALTVFEEARRTLSDELGAMPGEGLRQAHHLVLSGGGEQPGQEHLAPRQLPRDVAGFIGRAKETIRLRSLLDPWDDDPPHPFAAISGPPGVGKSALARHVAHMVRHRFPDGQMYVNLRGGTPNVPRLSSHEIFSRLLRSIGTPDSAIPTDEDEAAALWRSKVQDRRLLVLLDNAADLAQVRPFLSMPLGTAIVVTSRESLVAGDDCVQVSLDPLSDAEARTMLAKLVGAGRISADLDQSTRLVRLCDGFPLALRIAGARLADRPDWTVGALATRLTDERNRLQELETGELAVRSSLAASWNALNGSARVVDGMAARMLALLGVLHVPDITAEAAAVLSESSPVEAERALERLRDAHLLEGSERGRYHLHDLVRLFAGELTAVEERTAPLIRVLGYYAASARSAVKISDPNRVLSTHPRVEALSRRFESAEEAYAWLATEEPTLLAAAVQAMADPDDDVARLGAAIGLALWWYQQKSYRIADLISLGRRLLLTADRLKDEVIAMEAHVHVSTGLYYMGDVDAALRHQEEHLRLAQRLNDQFNVQRAHGNLANLYIRLEKFHDVLDQASAQRVIARQISSDVGERYAQLMLGIAYEGLGQLKDAVVALETGAAMAQRAGDAMHQASFGWTLGKVLIELGEPDAALSVLTDALEASLASKTKSTEAGCLVYLARAHRLLGQTGEAKRRIAEAVVLAERTGSAFWLNVATEERQAIGLAWRSINV